MERQPPAPGVCLVKQVVGGASARGDVAFGEGGHRVPDRSGRAARASAASAAAKHRPAAAASAGWAGPCRAAQPHGWRGASRPGPAGPDGPAGAGARRPPLRPSPARPPPGHRAGPPSPRAARSSRRRAGRRSSAKLQMPARPHRREQRGQVVARGRRGWAAAPPAPRSQSRNVSPAGADQSCAPGWRTHMTSAASAYSTQAGGDRCLAARPGRGGTQAMAGVGRRRVRLGSGGPRWPGGSISSRSGGPRNGELAKAATSTGPIACSRCQRQRKPDQPGPSPPASTQTWTEAVLHIMAAPWAAPVKELFHRRVAGQFEHAPRRAKRSSPCPLRQRPAWWMACRRAARSHARDVNAVTQTGRGCGTELHLAARLVGEHALAGERPGCPAGSPRWPLACGLRKSGIAAVTDEPLQFHPDPPGWPGFEADPVCLRFRVALGKRFRLASFPGILQPQPAQMTCHGDQVRWAGKMWVITLRNRRGVGSRWSNGRARRTTAADSSSDWPRPCRWKSPGTTYQRASIAGIPRWHSPLPYPGTRMRCSWEGSWRNVFATWTSS